MEFREVRRFQLGVKALEAVVAVVATLGELAATVAGPDDDVLQYLSPRSLRRALRKFTWTLRCTLSHQSVTSQGQRDVTSLRLALATLEASPGASLARAGVAAATRAWQDSVATLTESWDRLAEEATNLQGGWQDGRTKSGKWPGEARVLLGRLVDTCDKATTFPWEVLRRLGDIEAALEGTKEASADVPKALVATVAEAERLWEASARLTTRHLLGTLVNIHRLLVSPHDSPDGPGGWVVAERCQRATEDIPRLLEECDVTNVTS